VVRLFYITFGYMLKPSIIIMLSKNALHLVLGAFLLVFISCKPENANFKPTNNYDTEQLIKKVILKLESEKPKFFKTSFIENKTETKQITEPNWKKEFVLMEQANLNKSALQGMYKTDSVTHGPVKIVNYRAIKPGLPADSLQVIYYFNKVSHINATVAKANILASSKRVFNMNFDQKGRLVNFSLVGFEKIIFSDSAHFQLEGRLEYPILVTDTLNPPLLKMGVPAYK
jgi:hypothetical protein